MRSVPLAARLRRSTHRSVALAQDTMMIEVYDSFPECVLHGGTAIWRCYGGGRFSEDVDVYLPTREVAGIRGFRESLAAKGMRELKFKTTENKIFGRYDLDGSVVRFEAALRQPPASVVRPYEMVDGSLMLVRTLSPEDLLLEKVAAYSSRRKIRDLYDIFFLLNLVEDRARVLPGVVGMVKGFQGPVDEAQLRAVVIAGVSPSADTMLQGVRRWARQST